MLTLTQAVEIHPEVPVEEPRNLQGNCSTPSGTASNLHSEVS